MKHNLPEDVPGDGEALKMVQRIVSWTIWGRRCSGKRSFDGEGPAYLLSSVSRTLRSRSAFRNGFVM